MLRGADGERHLKVERAKEILAGMPCKRVAVFGDLMLDRYIWGRATRISQEAPVPIVAVSRRSAAPGGAANVLRNIASLGGQAAAYGVIGDDANADDLLALLDEQTIEVSGVMRDGARTTTEKTRIVAEHQQVVRIDVEEYKPIGDAHVRKVVEQLDGEAAKGALQAIIVEDYNKGMVTEKVLRDITEVGTRHGIPVALDPHPGNEACVEGVTILTPNRTEAFAMAGVYLKPPPRPVTDDTALREVVRILQDRWKVRYLLVTLGGDGMALYQNGGPPLHIPTQAKEVFDVSGAGDTVVASFVLALIAGASAEEAAVISNHAAGVVVGKVGTAPVSAEELLESFQVEE